MRTVPLHCSECGRGWALAADVRIAELVCPACDGPLRPGAGQRRRAPRDTFRGRTVGGVRLRKLLAVRPGCLVYRGLHKQLKADVRVEVFPADFADSHADSMADLFRRAAVTRDLRSPSVAALLDLGRVPRCWFIASERLPGALREMLERKGRLDPGHVLHLAAGILEGLAAIEEAGAFHGNVTPEGVLLALEGTPKLDHLGTAVSLRDEGRLTVTPGGTTTGRAFYMAPEGASDVRSDLYSLGVTLYEALAGRRPYEGTTAEDVRRAHARDPVPDARSVRPELPAPLCRFVMRLMAKAPSDRPQHAADAVAELDRCAARMSETGDLDAGTGAQPFVRRLFRELGIAGKWAAVAIVLVALAVVPAAILQRGRAERREAEPAVARSQPGAVMVWIDEPDAMPAEQALAVRAVLALALSECPELHALDPFYVAELQQSGRGADQALGLLNPSYVLSASSVAGFHRRNWTLTLTRNGRPEWTVRTECSVDDAWQSDLAGMDAAARGLIGQAAARLELPPTGDRQPRAVSGSAWTDVGRALRCEQEGRWDEAGRHARSAADGAPDAPEFAFLAVFYQSVAALRSGRQPGGALDPATADALPGEMPGLAGILEAMAGGREAEVEQRLGQHLAAFPRSSRGYYLLGTWRRRRLNQPNEALIAFKQAASNEPTYTAAALACVEIIAERGQSEAMAFIEMYRRRVAEGGRVDLVARRAEEVLLATETSGRTGGNVGRGQ